jgi:hypothetical protein
VEQDDVGRERSQRRLQTGGAERDPVSVGGRQPQRAVLVAVGVGTRIRVVGAPRDYEVMLECAGAPRVVGLGLEVGVDTAAPLAVEDRDVGDSEHRIRWRE